MRGSDQRSGRRSKARVRANHPLRPIRMIVNEALAALHADVQPSYADDVGPSSIPPERLLRALLLQAF